MPYLVPHLAAVTHEGLPLAHCRHFMHGVEWPLVVITVLSAALALSAAQLLQHLFCGLCV